MKIIKVDNHSTFLSTYLLFRDAGISGIRTEFNNKEPGISFQGHRTSKTSTLKSFSITWKKKPQALQLDGTIKCFLIRMAFHTGFPLKVNCDCTFKM